MADDQPIHETATEVRGGTGPGVMRWILPVSLALVIRALAIIVATGWTE